jgi:CubicO group peptidase (beta-lactamase class C family)
MPIPTSIVPQVTHRALGVPSRIDAVIDAALDTQRVVGTVVKVLRDGQLVYRRAAGLADREAKRPMREDTVFRLASVTKPIVSVAVLRLIDQGLLSLETPVGQYLPDFAPRLADGSAPPITVHQLLSHTAGLSYGHFEPTDGPYLRAGVSDGLDRSGLSLQEELRRITHAGLAYAPGSSWGYSVAIDVLGALLERVSRQPLRQLVKELVTAPLAMNDTDFAAPAPERLAVPYADGSPPSRMGELEILPFMGLSGIRLSPDRVLVGDSFASGGAGMVGTAEDVARLLEAVRSGGAGLLRPATAKAMRSNQVATFPVALGPGWGFGYGGAVLTDPVAANSPQSAGTWSWGGAWGHSWFVDPDAGLVVVALTNTAIEGMMGQFPAQLRDAVYGA